MFRFSLEPLQCLDLQFQSDGSFFPIIIPHGADVQRSAQAWISMMLEPRSFTPVHSLELDLADAHGG